MITSHQRLEINYRSGGMCEGMVKRGAIWTRCWQTPVEIHHLLTRARGGGVLDRVGEIYHLIALCTKHHQASDGQEAYLAGLLIDGSVSWDKSYRKPVYQGTDVYLKERYGSYV